MDKKFSFFFNFLWRNNKLHTFILFFLLSVFLWFLSQLGKTYRYDLAVAVRYTHLPEDVLMEPSGADSLHLKIETGGYQILKMKLFKPSFSIDYNTIQLENKNEWKPAKNIRILNELLGDEQKIIQIFPEKISIIKNKQDKKQVRIAARVEIHYKQGYKNSSVAQLNPDRIWIFGSEELLQSIDTIYTESFKLKQIDKDVDISIPLIIPEGIKSKVTKINYHLPVNMFIEGSQKVELRAVNVPPSKNIIPFPKKVNVTYKVFKKDFKRIDSKNFDVIIDYNNRYNNEKDNLIRAQLYKYPKEIFDYQIVPEKIAFLLKNNDK